MILEALAATLICLDPGHGTVPSVGAQREPIGPGSRTLKIKDPGGAAGEAPVALAIARRTRALLVARGYRVAMTRERAGYTGGNVDRAKFCNARRAALMIRIHADGSTNSSQRGVHTLYPRAPPRGGRTTSFGRVCSQRRRSSARSCGRPERATSGSSAGRT